MLSLNQQKQLFNDKQLNLANLSSGTFMFDPPAEQISSVGGITYPLTAIETIEADLDTNQFSTEFDFVVAGLVHEDRTNKDDVMSAMLRNALDLYSQIKQTINYVYNEDISLTSKFQPLEDFNLDRAYGWGFRIRLEQFYDRSTCSTPESDNHAGQVTIYNSDGSVAAYLNPNSTYTLSSMATNTSETYTLSSSTQNVLQPPAFVYGVYAPNIRLVQGDDYTLSGNTFTIIDPNYIGVKLIFVYAY